MDLRLPQRRAKAATAPGSTSVKGSSLARRPLYEFKRAGRSTKSAAAVHMLLARYTAPSFQQPLAACFVCG